MTDLLQLVELFDFVDDVLVWVKDRDFRYQWVNRAFLLNYALRRPQRGPGAGADEIVGRTDYDISPPFLADQYRLDDEQVLAGNRILHRIELVGEPDGFSAWHVTNKIPVHDQKGRVVGAAGMTRALAGCALETIQESGFGTVLSHLRDHYQENLTNQHLARLAHMSVRAFERKFQASFRLTPQKYLRRLRLQIASRALVYTSRSLVDVALRSGFADQSHFTREFRRHFGRTPGEYRDHYAASGTDSAAFEQSIDALPPKTLQPRPAL